MSTIIDGRVTAKIEGDFVVFIIGLRVNRWWKIHKWLPAVTAMPKMLKELMANPDSGFLGVMGTFPWMVQYWRSFEHLTNYAKNRDAAHYPAWVAFNKRVGSSGDVGIFHETYLVRAGEYETIYSGIQKTGLGKFTELVPAKGRYASAAKRAGKENVDSDISVAS